MEAAIQIINRGGMIVAIKLAMVNSCADNRELAAVMSFLTITYPTPINLIKNQYIDIELSTGV